MEWKTYFTDGLVSIAVLLSLLRTDWNNYLNSSLYDGYPEIQEIIMGPLSGYTQTYIHANEWHLGSIGSSHPKSMTFDYSSSIFNDIHSLARYQQFNRDMQIDAFLVGETQSPLLHVQSATGNQAVVATQTSPEGINNEHASSNPNNGSRNLPSPLVEGAADNDDDRSQSFAFELFGSDLTKEDMELIEILWRQDIDLGVGREAYNTTQRQEQDRQENELAKQNNLQAKNAENSQNLTEENNNNMAYIIDQETGELVPASLGTSHILSNDQYLQPQIPQQPETQDVSIEEALQFLETRVTGFSLSDSANMTLNMSDPGDISMPDFSEQLQELDNLINNASSLYSDVAQRETLEPEELEQQWNDISNWLPINNTSNDTDLNALTDILNGFTSTNHTDIADQLLLQNTSMVPHMSLDNISFTEGFNQTDMSPTTSMEMSSSLDCVTTASLGLRNISLPSSPSIVNSTDSLLQQLLHSTIPNIDFSTLNITDAQAMDINETSDTAPTSVTSFSLHELQNAPHIQDMSDYQSNISSPYDTLEGATGGSEIDCSSGYESKSSQKYEPEFEYGQLQYDNDRRYVNHSDESNSSYTEYKTSNDARHVEHNHSYPLQPGQTPKERKTKSMKQEADQHDAQYTRDQKRAKSMNIPLSMDDMINSPVEVFNDMIEQHTFTDSQLQLIRDIRRRGKNKVAAQNCRKRKMEVIQTLEEEVEKIRQKRNELASQRRNLEKESSIWRQKYSKMCDNVFRDLRDDQGQPYDPNEYALQQNDDGEIFLVPHNATSYIKDETKSKSSRKRKNDRKGH